MVAETHGDDDHGDDDHDEFRRVGKLLEVLGDLLLLVWTFSQKMFVVVVVALVLNKQDVVVVRSKSANLWPLPAQS